MFIVLFVIIEGELLMKISFKVFDSSSFDYVDIENINLSQDKLTLTLSSSEGTITVELNNLEGFRVLDERDLTEFWSVLSLEDGFIFQIIEGGWFSLEEKREGFLLKYDEEKQTEYLIISENLCVSVFANDEPSVNCSSSGLI